MKVEWRTQKPDGDGVVWNDLIDPTMRKQGANWVITYRDYYSSWHVMWNLGYEHRDDQLISKNVTEQQLRDNLRLEYLLTRGETNNVR